MNVPFVLRGASVLVCVLAATSGWSQDLPAIPLRIDPAFWGHANKPYTLKLTVTTTSVDGSNGPQTVVTEQNVSRDSAGRESTEGFYDSGQPRSVWVRDPGKGTLTMMQVVGKLAWVHPMPPPALPLKATCGPWNSCLLVSSKVSLWRGFASQARFLPRTMERGQPIQ